MWGSNGMVSPGTVEWMPLMGMSFGLLLLALLVAAAIAVLRVPDIPNSEAGKEGGRSAGLEVLAERYARGEIARDEYLEKLQDISGRHPAA